MSKIKIVEEISGLKAIHLLSRVYAEIAAVRIKRTRNAVLQSRDFLSGVREVFDQVNISYREKVLELMKQRGRRDKKVTFLSHNGKTVAVFLSANTGLYGDIVNKTFDQFMEEVKLGEVEATVVGRLGQMLFQDKMGKDYPVSFFDLPDHENRSEDLMPIAKHLVQYENIHIYHGKFKSLVSQEPTRYDISAGSELAETKEEVKYIFEPTLEDIMSFFETEIFASLFDQTVRESQLAKFASRLLAMDQAGENIRKKLDSLHLERRRVVHRVANRKQLETISSMPLW